MTQRIRTTAIAATALLLAILATVPRFTSPSAENHPVLGAARSSQWPAVERAHLAEHPECAVCGSKEQLNVHHVVPFHVRPDLELERSNLITLCRNHHFWWGHLGSWRSWNPDVREDAAIWRKKIEGRP